MPAILHVSYLVSALYGCLYLCLFLYVCELTKSSLVKPYGVWTLYFISLSRTRCDAYLAFKATFSMHAVNNLYRCQMVRHSLQAPRGPFFQTPTTIAGIEHCTAMRGSAIDASPLTSRRVGPLPLIPARWAPHCSFRSTRSAQISRFSLKFPTSLNIFFFSSFVSRSAFLVFGFWFLVLALLRLISNRFSC